MVKSILFLTLALILVGCGIQSVNRYGDDIGVRVDGTCRLVDAQKIAPGFANAFDLQYTLSPAEYITLKIGETYYCTVEVGSWIKIENAWDNLVRISYCLKGFEYGSMVVTYQNLQETLAKEPDKFKKD